MATAAAAARGKPAKVAVAPDGRAGGWRPRANGGASLRNVASSEKIEWTSTNLTCCHHRTFCSEVQKLRLIALIESSSKTGEWYSIADLSQNYRLLDMSTCSAPSFSRE